MKPIKAPVSEVVAQNVRCTMNALGITYEQLAGVMGVSRGTVYNRFLNPEEFQIGELQRLSDYANQHRRKKISLSWFFKAQCGDAVCS